MPICPWARPQRRRPYLRPARRRNGPRLVRGAQTSDCPRGRWRGRGLARDGAALRRAVAVAGPARVPRLRRDAGPQRPCPEAAVPRVVDGEAERCRGCRHGGDAAGGGGRGGARPCRRRLRLHGAQGRAGGRGGSRAGARRRDRARSQRPAGVGSARAPRPDAALPGRRDGSSRRAGGAWDRSGEPDGTGPADAPRDAGGRPRPGPPRACGADGACYRVRGSVSSSGDRRVVGGPRSSC